MKKENKNILQSASIRQKAESKLKKRKKNENINPDKADSQKLIHELEVHQIELEMQNQELTNIRDSIEKILEKYTQFYDFAPTGFFTLDRKGIISELNLSGALMFGKERLNLINNNFKLYVTQNTLSVFDDFLHKIFDSKIKSTCEIMLDREDKRQIFALLEGVVTEDGKKCLATMTDITYIKNIEKKLQNSNESKNKYFRILAHDLRGPFQGLLLLSEILNSNFESLSKDEIKNLGIKFDKSLNHLFGLLNDLLEWSRLQSGNFDLDNEKFLLHSLIQTVIDTLTPWADQKGIKLINSVDNNIQIIADRKMMELIFRNLISNGIKFTKKNGFVEVSESRKNMFLKITVSDNGIGIKKEDLEKLFKLEDHPTSLGTENEKGTGLGLSICKEIVEKHGGIIYAESEFEKGSKFIFTLFGVN